MLVDSHCHLESAEFAGDLPEVLRRAEEAGVGRMLCIGSGDWAHGSLSQAVVLAEQFDLVDATIGMHPHDAGSYSPGAEENILRYVEHPKVVGWGEIGLDYHYGDADGGTQRSVFRRQMELAYQWRIPVVIHSRDAESDTLQILKKAPRLPLAGVMHCFSGGWTMAQECLDLGFFISFAGNVTFKKAVALQNVARRVPLERLLVETDAPYLAPVPFRGKRNEPANVRHTVRFLADLRGESCDSLERNTAENYFRLFKPA